MQRFPLPSSDLPKNDMLVFSSFFVAVAFLSLNEL